MKFVYLASVIVDNSLASTHLVKLSIAMIANLACARAVRNGPIKSIPHFANGQRLMTGKSGRGAASEHERIFGTFHIFEQGLLNLSVQLASNTPV